MDIGSHARRVRGAMALGIAAVTVAVLVVPPAARAQETYEPRSGQPGKDVVWVPTPDGLVERMLDLGDVDAGDYVIDLGSGDGRTVIAAARRGARAHGIEYNEDMVRLAQANAQREGVADRATFEQADLFTRLDELKKADVITLFLLSSLNLKLRPTLLELEPGTRIVSNTFRMSDWEPDEQSQGQDCADDWCEALLWIVPAKVEGSWRVGDQTLNLSQDFQRVMGTLGTADVMDGRLTGREISFKVGETRYVGTVSGDTIDGLVTGTGGGAGVPFRAIRTAVLPGERAPVTASAAAPAAETLHTVQHGETLSTISQRYYGRASAYERIFEANRNQLDHPDRIHAGQVLKVPQ